MFIHRKTDLSARFIGEMADTVLPSGTPFGGDTDTALWDVPSGKPFCVGADTTLWDMPSGKPFCEELTQVGKQSVHVFMR